LGPSTGTLPDSIAPRTSSDAAALSGVVVDQSTQLGCDDHGDVDQHGWAEHDQDAG